MLNILEKFGSSFAQSGIVSKVEAAKVADPEFKNAFTTEYILAKGNEMERAYRAYAELAKQENFRPLVEKELSAMADVAGIKSQEAKQSFINSALNDTENFIARANKALKEITPDQMTQIISKSSGDQVELRRDKAVNLAREGAPAQQAA
jgi:hypothetical protein